MQTHTQSSLDLVMPDCRVRCIEDEEGATVMLKRLGGWKVLEAERCVCVCVCVCDE